MGNKKSGKVIFILFSLLFFANSVFALTLTHPEQQHMTVDEDGIFFSGKIKKSERVFINGVQMNRAKFGAFSYSFPLKEGENIFAVQKKEFLGHNETITYTITRVSANHKPDYNKFIEEDKAYLETTRDNVVLRSTPIDAGMNRLGYLPKGTKVAVDGRFNEFSRIYLAKDKYGWAMTKDLAKSENEAEFVYTPKSLLSVNQVKTDIDTTYTFSLSENVPYSAVVEDNKLVVTIYNLDDNDETYTKEFTLDKFPRYSVCMQNGILYVIFKSNPLTDTNYSNKNVKIVIDAGHGGKELGAVGCLGDKEKNINLDVALRLKKILEEHQFDVKLTRETDKYVSLEDRIKFAKDNDALIFVSIHMNSVPISDNPLLNKGTLVFYFNPQCKQISQIVSKSISKDLHTVDGGATQRSFAVVRPTEYIGILAELAYLVNPDDVAIYKNKKFAQTSAVAIYNGLVDYIHSEL